MSIHKQNVKLKNISYISSKPSKYHKPNYYMLLDDNNTSKRGQINQYHSSNKQSQSSLLKKNNELLISKRDSNSQTHCQSKKGFFINQGSI